MGEERVEWLTEGGLVMIFLGVQNLTPPWAPPAPWLVICRGAARDWQAATGRGA